MFKKFLSVLLSVLMVVSVMAVGVVATSAADLDPNMLYFDVKTTGWELGDKDKVGFYAFPLSDEVSPNYTGWGGKRLQGSDKDGDGIWEYDPKNFLLEDGVQYKIIFTHVVSNAFTSQTYDLFFDTTCLGHVAYCNDTTYENPADSSKKALAAFWEGKDPTEYGPVLQVSSIGNVVGTCPEQGKTPLDIFVDFIAVANDNYNGKTGLENARYYTVEQAKSKTEQKMIDDIGTALSLTKDEVENAFTENSVETAWIAADSVLPGGEAPHVHTPGEPVQENVKDATCTEDGSYDEVVYCVEDNEEISRETKTIPATGHTAGEPVVENEKAATCTEDGSYDTVVYCTVCNEEISRETITVPATGHTAGEPVVENEKAATCTEDGSYDTVVYCTVCNEEISRETVTVPALGHTPAEAVKDNVVEADCENAGGYDEVIKCEVCGEVISSTHVDVPALGHDIVFVEEVPATASTDGVKAHYECTRCGKLYADADGSVEVTAEDLVIKAEHVRGDADGDGEVTILDATTIQRVLAEMSVENYDEVAADADLDGIVDIIDVTLIQRVLADITTFDKWDAAHQA